jgi:hypothetical protein
MTGGSSHYRKRPFLRSKITENGVFLSQTAFFRANAIETGPLDIKCDSDWAVLEAPPEQCTSPLCNILTLKSVLMA